jgi:hypothetical protein
MFHGVILTVMGQWDPAYAQLAAFANRPSILFDAIPPKLRPIAVVFLEKPLRSLQWARFHKQPHVPANKHENAACDVARQTPHTCE